MSNEQLKGQNFAERVDYRRNETNYTSGILMIPAPHIGFGLSTEIHKYAQERNDVSVLDVAQEPPKEFVQQISQELIAGSSTCLILDNAEHITPFWHRFLHEPDRNTRNYEFYEKFVLRLRENRLPHQWMAYEREQRLSAYWDMLFQELLLPYAQTRGEDNHRHVIIPNVATDLRHNHEHNGEGVFHSGNDLEPIIPHESSYERFWKRVDTALQREIKNWMNVEDAEKVAFHCLNVLRDFSIGHAYGSRTLYIRDLKALKDYSEIEKRSLFRIMAKSGLLWKHTYYSEEILGDQNQELYFTHFEVANALTNGLADYRMQFPIVVNPRKK